MGITHFEASTFVRGQEFHVILTPSIPSGSAAATGAAPPPVMSAVAIDN